MGESVAFLNLGDPTVYGTYMEIHWRMRRDGYRAGIVSGVPSFCAVAAALELSLIHIFFKRPLIFMVKSIPAASCKLNRINV